MSGQLRHDIVQKKGVLGLRANSGSNISYFSVRQILLLLIFSAILLLPFFFGFRPVSTFIGEYATSDIISRVNFQWSIADKGLIIQEVEETHYPIYARVPRSLWMENVFTPVSALLENAVDLKESELLLNYAQKEKIDLTASEAKIITDYVLNNMKSGLYTEVVNPVRNALDSWIYSRGVIDTSRYIIETKDGPRRIEIINPEDRFSQGEIMEISKDGVIIIAGDVKRILDEVLFIRLGKLRLEFRKSLADILARQIAKNPTLVYEEVLTEDTLKQRIDYAVSKASNIEKGQNIVFKGEIISKELFAKLLAENEAYATQRGAFFWAQCLIGKLALVFGICLFFISLIHIKNQRSFLLGTMLFATIVCFLMYFLIYNGVSLALLPVGFLAACVAIAGGVGSGMLITGCFCVFFLTISGGQSAELLAILASCCAYSALAPKQRFRMALAKVSIIAGLLGVLVFLCWHVGAGAEIYLPRKLEDILSLAGGANPVVRAVWILLSWIASYCLLLTILPFMQRIFGVTTNIRLQDMQEHPLLNKLLVEAPSTYYHCSVGAALSEAAALACGANALFCKTATLYHDIGKLVKPEYFTENESGISRHDALSPSMSALIIISHVKDGAELAAQWGLPQAIIDIIEQHHGTTPVGFFLKQAKEEAEDPDNIDESQFRYPGPKPQSAEAAAIMIADSVEAASRSLDGASPSRIRSLVHKIILGKLEDRQFDECGLSFTDLANIEDALVRILQSMFHARVSYDRKSK